MLNSMEMISRKNEGANLNYTYGDDVNDEQIQDQEINNNVLQNAANSSRDRRRRGFLVFFFAMAFMAIAVDYMTERRIEHACTNFIHWVEVHPLWGVLAVICVYIVATILFIPGAILTIGCGFAFRSAFDSTTKGVIFATVAVFFGAFLGSLCSFLLGRYLFRDWVLSLAAHYPVLRAIDRGTFCKTLVEQYKGFHTSDDAECFLILLFSCPESTGEEWIQNYDSATPISFDSVQCLGLYQWNHIHFLRRLRTGTGWNTSRYHYVLYGRSNSIKSDRHGIFFGKPTGSSCQLDWRSLVCFHWGFRSVVLLQN